MGWDVILRVGKRGVLVVEEGGGRRFLGLHFGIQKFYEKMKTGAVTAIHYLHCDSLSDACFDSSWIGGFPPRISVDPKRIKVCYGMSKNAGTPRVTDVQKCRYPPGH